MGSHRSLLCQGATPGARRFMTLVLTLAGLLLVASVGPGGAAPAPLRKPAPAPAPQVRPAPAPVTYKGTFSGGAGGTVVITILGSSAKGYLTGQHRVGTGGAVKVHCGGQFAPGSGKLTGTFTGTAGFTGPKGKPATANISGRLTGVLKGGTFTGTWTAAASGAAILRTKGTWTAKRVAAARRK